MVIDRPGGGRGSWWAPKWAPGSSNGQGLPPMEILCFFSVTLALTANTQPQLQQEGIFWKLLPGLDILINQELLIGI